MAKKHENQENRYDRKSGHRLPVGKRNRTISFSWEKLIHLIFSALVCALVKFPPKRKKSNNKKAERFKTKKNIK